MIIGSVREIKQHEYRVGLTPGCVRVYVDHGHTVLVQRGAGEGAGFSDDEYARAGAELVDGAKVVFDRAEMVVKVKEPQPEECVMLGEGQLLFTYLHLAADAALTRRLMEIGVDAVPYETIETDSGHLPCLKPMSQIAGRLAIQEGAKYLEKRFGGRGVLLGGVPGVARGKVVVLGGGVVGMNACKVAAGLGAEVTVLDIDAERLAYFDDVFAGRITTLYSTQANIESALRECDVLIGAVLRHGDRAPHLVTRRQLALMKPGAVIVDVAIDQGGCVETSRPTTHDDPIFVEEGIVHYCVTNMPGVVALTATRALTGSTLRYGVLLADRGLEGACRESAAIRRGVNLCLGKCVYESVARSTGVEYTPLDSLLNTE